MKYEIRRLDWYKRRVPTVVPQPVKVEIQDIRLIRNSYCKMFVDYDDGVSCVFDARVEQNPITKKWVVHGFRATDGRQCLVDVIE